MSGTECGMLEKKTGRKILYVYRKSFVLGKGYEAMGKQAVRLGGETFAFFYQKSKRWKGKRD